MNLKEEYRIYAGVIFGIAVLFIFSVFIADRLSGEEAHLRRFILKGKRAVEEKNIFACADMISKDYSDKYGNDRQGLIYAVQEVFNYYKRIFVHIEAIKIKFDDFKTSADVEIVALVIGYTHQNNAEKILEGEKGRFRIKLDKIDKKWYLSEAEFLESITIMGQNIT